jgi:alpha-galactosidase
MQARQQLALTDWSPANSLMLADGSQLDHFKFRTQSTTAIADGLLGRGRQLTLVAMSVAQIEQSVELVLLENYPGMALLRVSYRNASARPFALHGWTNARIQLTRPQAAVAQTTEPEFWSFCGSTHADRRDWVQPVRPGFTQDNFMGMSASDYGGGTPIVDVWRRDGGIAIGHLETVPQLLSLPVQCTAAGVSLAMTGAMSGGLPRTLAAGESFATPATFIAVHSGDYFSVLDAYRRIMDKRGIASPAPPADAYESMWCAWGYERDCTLQLIEDTLPKVQELGLKWAVIDDGWQSNVGDWQLDKTKYPGGENDMQRLVSSIRARNLKPRLWWAPLAAAPGSDLLHDHTDMLLLDKDGAVQDVSWWNCFYLCPAYQPTIDYTLQLVRKFIGGWRFAGLKIDGQHLNAVAPCYNPAHHHARPEESIEKLQDLFLAVYQTATQIDPQAVVELCPCGTSYSFFNFRSFNQAPASDPESSWQVRHKGKTLKALMGPSAAFAGDHVELSTGGRDFASTVGIGAIISTKFTWPEDPKPKDSFLLTPEKEALWRKWIALYNERELPQGTYRGELYDIGFDKPETHVVEKAGRFYYAFYASSFSGSIPLRGLTANRYRVRDYFNGRDLGEVAGTHGKLQIAFNDFLVLEAIPV